jgi:FG-GAP repeat
MMAGQERGFAIALLATNLVACSALIDASSATYAADDAPPPPGFWNAGAGTGSVVHAAWFRPASSELLDSFGAAVVLQDDELLVVAASARLDQVESSAAESCGEIIDADGAGRIYSYSRRDDSWIEADELRRTRAQADEGRVPLLYFGIPRIAIARWGDTVAIGVPAAEHNRCDPGILDPVPEAGKVHLFERAADGRWMPSKVLSLSSPSAGDHFGAAVALREDVLFVGAIGADGNAPGPNEPVVKDSGAVYVFQRDGSDWRQVQRLEPGSPRSDAHFGNALSVDGDTLAVGAWRDSSGMSGAHACADRVDGTAPSLQDSGAAYLFRERAGRWAPTLCIKAPRPSNGAQFGLSVALRENLLLIGAPYESSSQPSASAAEFDEGAPFEDLQSAGAVYAYQWSHEAWRFDHYLKAFDPRAESRFGVALSIRGDHVLVGAPFEDGQRDGEVVKAVGAAYLYARGTGASRPVAKLAPADAQPKLLFGLSAALGEHLAVIGAPGEDVQAIQGRLASFELDE